MRRVNPKYLVYVTYENGVKVLYLRLVKALYGCIKSALLWYDLFVKTLQKKGFSLKPYNPCVANSVIDGSQCTITWHVNDNKILHVSATVVKDVIEHIERHFGKMTVTRGD